MANENSGDTRVRRRITSIIRGDGVSAVGSYSIANSNIKWCDKHYITIIRFGVVTSGVISIRGKPVIEPPLANASPVRAALLGIEGIDFSKAANLSWEVGGFFDAFELAITTIIGGGGNIAAVINSVDTNA